MEVELTLSSELEDLSEEYGLSRESESATASVPDDQQGTLDNSLYLDTRALILILTGCMILMMGK